MRGSRDGFVETLVFNTALIRRRIRDPKLTMEILTTGESSHTDIAMCYMEGRADKKTDREDQKEDTECKSRCPFHEPGKSGRVYFSGKMV